MVVKIEHVTLGGSGPGSNPPLYCFEDLDYVKTSIVRIGSLTGKQVNVVYKNVESAGIIAILEDGTVLDKPSDYIILTSPPFDYHDSNNENIGTCREGDMPLGESLRYFAD